ncbi:MAG: sterol desaturase family protein [Blastocatellia bacterium]|nr:sterol desaturase family protein [Blastocatellia bacterium]
MGVLIRAGLAAIAVGALVWLERRRPLRRTVEPALRRNLRNAVVAAMGGVALRLLERPVTDRLTAMAVRHRIGLLQRFNMPKWAETLLAVVLLDYTLYVWHVLTHRVPLLWRFHIVHHADLDMDASTAVRFHVGELVMSIGWRAGQVLLIGVPAEALDLWQKLVIAAILFHHSNLRLPIDLERALVQGIVTPRMHGVHHSVVRAEADSNWSTILSVWDRLHGTLRLNVPQDEIEIGVPAFRTPDQLGLLQFLTIPLVASGRDLELADATHQYRAR